MYLVMIQVVYTNSNCSDVFTPFLKQNKKHCNIPLYLISDYQPDYDPDKTFIYDNDEPYYLVWSNALKKFNSESFIYLQEDFFLYSDVNRKLIEKYKELLFQSDYSFIRLLKSGKLNNKQIFENLYEIESDNENIFSMQATLWKTFDYIKIMEAVKDQKWLENDNYRNKMIELGLKGLYHYDGEPKVGKYHHNSNVYPYTATAIVRGEWNFSEYANELGPILEENNINCNLRGKF